MSGVTKHIYDHEIRDIISMWNMQLKSIQELLPKGYKNEDIVEMLKHFYPHEWYSVEVKYWYYNKKDKYLKKHFGKTRYMQIASLNGHLCHIWRPACDLNGGQPRTH